MGHSGSTSSGHSKAGEAMTASRWMTSGRVHLDQSTARLTWRTCRHSLHSGHPASQRAPEPAQYLQLAEGKMNGNTPSAGGLTRDTVTNMEMDLLAAPREQGTSHSPPLGTRNTPHEAHPVSHPVHHAHDRAWSAAPSPGKVQRATKTPPQSQGQPSCPESYKDSPT